MERIWTAAELKKADAETMELGLASPVLMERAALAVLDVMLEEKLDLSGAVVVCGTGNNGGDGIAVARLLAEQGYRPLVLTVGDPERYSSERTLQESILRSYEVDFCTASEEIRWEEKTLVVDALFGIGLSRPVKSEYEKLIEKINGSGLPVVAVDIPSGVHTDTGAVLGCAVKAAHTVSFSGEKAGLLLYPGKTYAGKVHIKKIGIRMPEENDDHAFLRVAENDLAMLPERDESGNKGTFGKVLVIAGSRTVCGAAILAGKACLRSGAGMVRIYTEVSNRIPVAAAFPEALLDTYKEDEWTEGELSAALGWADAVLIGPGIGTGKTAEKILEYVLKNAEMPLAMDADALNLLRGEPERICAYPGPVILTPHVMEMSRLSGQSCAAVKADPRSAAVRMAERSNACVVLKDAVTLIADPSGKSCLYGDGSSALATAGSGDVLAGITAALLVNDPERVFTDAALAVCLHGRTGEAAAGIRSRASVTAGDLIDLLVLP